MTWRGGQVVLGPGGDQIEPATRRSGPAIALRLLGKRDDLTTDTAEVYRTAVTPTTMNVPVGPSTRGPRIMCTRHPLFGRIDDPSYGSEPPLVSHPPWWPALRMREPINLPAQRKAKGCSGRRMPGRIRRRDPG